MRIGEGDEESAIPLGAGVSLGDEVSNGALDVSRTGVDVGLMSGDKGESVSKG